MGIPAPSPAHRLESRQTRTAGAQESDWFFLCPDTARTPGIDRRQGKKLVVVLFIKPRALEGFDRQAGAAGQGQGIDGQLGDSVLLLPGLGLVIEDMKEARAQLQEVDVAGDGVIPEREGKAPGLEIGEVVWCEVDRTST